MQLALNEVAYWYKRNKLSVNTSKSNTMLINGKRKVEGDLAVNLDGCEITQVDCIKYLGVHVDKDLTWYTHVGKLHKNVMGKLAVLRRLSKFLPRQTLELIFKTTILPCIDYADTVWGTCSEKGLKMAQRLQNAAARIVTKNYDYINVRGEDIVRSLKWQTIKERRQFHMATLMFKCTRGLAPNYLCDQVTFVNDINHYPTRFTTSNNIHIPFPKKSVFKRSFVYDGACIFNSLPAFLKDCDNVYDFKRMYKCPFF